MTEFLESAKIMACKKVLIIYSRDIAINDSGGSRTTIQLANYIASKKGYTCYCFFRIIEGNEGKIQEVFNATLSVENLHKIIIEESIDILLVPEAEQLSKIAYDAAIGTKCKIVSALHNKPGYERIGFYNLLKESLLYNDKFFKRVRALLLISIYPLSFYVYTRSIILNIRRAYSLSDYTVLLSRSFFDQFKEAYKVNGDNKLVAIENALSFENFATKDDLKNKKKQILVVSRLDERQKRISVVLRAWNKLFKKYPDWELLIVGSGRSQKSYINLANKLGLERFKFLGQRKPESFYREASIFLMTSAYEGWGMTLTEAQQYGCVPIVMDSYSAVHDIIDSGYNGIISPNNELDEYVSNISKIIENEDLRQSLAMNGISSSKRFTHDKVSEKWIRLFDKM
ncbi:MAG: glycosyltransferase [Candidatus Izemoplasmatales bacterium]|nr:glycosyltransferase [Candidatus Izemoplasmatales bacterium]